MSACSIPRKKTGGEGGRKRGRREGEKKREGGRGGSGGGMGGGKDADFSPVASGLRQFGFEPRLQSQSRATQKSQNRKGVANQCAKGRTEASPPPPHLDPSQLSPLLPHCLCLWVLFYFFSVVLFKKKKKKLEKPVAQAV